MSEESQQQVADASQGNKKGGRRSGQKLADYATPRPFTGFMAIFIIVWLTSCLVWGLLNGGFRCRQNSGSSQAQVDNKGLNKTVKLV